MGHENSGWYRTGKMTPADRKEAIRLIKEDDWEKAAVARAFNVSRTYIYALLKKDKKEA